MTMKIFIHAQGGLGNQLFQYACGRSLARKMNADLVIDDGWYKKTHEGVTPRDFMLRDLNVKTAFITMDSFPKKSHGLMALINKIFPRGQLVHEEKFHFKYDQNLDKISYLKEKSVYLNGYWQSFRYFEKIRQNLESELRPLIVAPSYYQNILSQIQKSHSAMLHIRRGDYILSKSASKIHGFLGLDYYQRAMDYLLGTNQNTQFFIFSDDMDWAKENLPHKSKCVFISPLPLTISPIYELELMKACKVHVIANSSLSWWGAWLKEQIDYPTICPKSWTNSHKLDLNDLLPNTWLRI